MFPVSVYVVGPFQLDANRLTLKHESSPIALGPKVVETLLVLAEHPGRVVSKQQVLERVWADGFVEDANLSQNIYVLRCLFRSYGCANPIETVPGVGYRLTAKALVNTTLEPRAVPGLSGRTRAYLGTAFALACAIVVVASIQHRASSKIEPALSPQGTKALEIGRYFWDSRSREGVRESLSYFASVVDSDPANSRGYAYLSEANAAMGDYCYGTHRPDVYFARAQAYAQKALMLDPNSSDAHAALGLVALHRSKFLDGVNELQEAISLDPSNADAHEWLGIALLRSGKRAAAVDQLEIATKLDPLSAPTLAWLGAASYLDGRFNQAITYAREALELSPRRGDALRIMGQAYASQGEMPKAIEAFKKYQAVDPYDSAAAAALISSVVALGRSKISLQPPLAPANLRKQTLSAHPSWASLENNEHFGVVSEVGSLH